MTGEQFSVFVGKNYMRRTVSVFVCVLMAGFYAGLNAQIPERSMFQPGSFAVPYYRAEPQQTVAAVTTVASSEDREETDDPTTEWEKMFSPQMIEPTAVQPMVQPYAVPHLTFVYNHWTGRFHIAPYEPGYAANPSAFPTQTSPLHIWVSSKASSGLPSPQVPYMSYYDPDPVVLPAEIQLRGSRIAGPFTQLQPVPMPLPRPESARLLVPPRTRFGETRMGTQMQKTFGSFIVR